MQRCIDGKIEKIINDEMEKAKKNIMERIKFVFLDSGISDELLSYDNIPIEDVGFPSRIENCLKKSGICTLRELVLCSTDDLNHIHNLGDKSRNQLESILLEKYNLTIRK